MGSGANELIWRTMEGVVYSYKYIKTIASARHGGRIRSPNAEG